jgi:integrase/recombinase XerD
MTITPFHDTRTTRKNNLYPIFVRISHGKHQRLIPSGYRVEKKYWNNKVIKHPDAHIINSKIADIVSNAQSYYSECLRHNRPVNINLIGTGSASQSFNKYLLHRAKQYREKNQIITARKVERSVKELELCFGGDIYFDAITQDHLRTLETWQIKQHNADNTRADKFEKFGQYFQHAKDEGLATIPNPFHKYKIVRKPVKREKLTPQEIEALENLECRGEVNNARNLFLFSYYCKGQRFESCIMAQRSDIKNGRIYFKTNKGEKFLSVKIHAKLQAIIDQYDSKFIFPYVDHLPKDERERIKMVDTLNVMVNRSLRIAAGIAGIEKPCTMHIARHSFASHLKSVTGNINIIQEALGHSKQSTTARYLKELDDEVLDSEIEKLYGK